MPIQIVFKDGSAEATCDEVFCRDELRDRPARLGDRFLLAGVEREVVLTIELPGTTGISFLPDFKDPRCQPCGERLNPPDIDWCRAHCELRPGL